MPQSAQVTGSEVVMAAAAERSFTVRRTDMSPRRRPSHSLALRISKALEREYETADLGNRTDPIEELVYIALTRQTHQKNALRSWQAITDAGGLAAILDMSERQLQHLLGPAGLSKQKARWIKGSLTAVAHRFGELSLSATRDWADEALEAFLRSLPGISIKSAKCIMMYSMGRRVLPVDVHVRRVATRLGLVEKGLSEKAIHSALERQIAPEDRHAFHVNSVWHGRKVCVARNPKCHQCVIQQLCAFRCSRGDERA